MEGKREKIQGSDIPYVHSTTNNINATAAFKKANSTYRNALPTLTKYIARVKKNREALNKSIKQKRGEYLDFVDILNEVAHEDGDEGIKAIVDFNIAAAQLSYAFNGSKKSNGNKKGIWSRSTEKDGPTTLKYKNLSGEKQYQSLISGLENFSKVMAYFKRREGWFTNNSATLQKYMKDEDGKIPTLYDQARQSFEKIAASIKTLDDLVGTDISKLFTYKETENNGIEIVSSAAFTKFLNEWWGSKIKPTLIGFEAEPLTNKILEIVDEKLDTEIESKGIGILKALGDISITVKGQTYYASIKTNIEGSKKRTALQEDGTFTKPSTGHAVIMSPGERYWLATLYTNSFLVIDASKNGAQDRDIMEQSYYDLLIAYAIRSTTGRLAQEKSDICILIVNDTAIWYDEFLKKFWDNIMREKNSLEEMQALANFYLFKPKDLFSHFATSPIKEANNNQELYNIKRSFLDKILEKENGAKFYKRSKEMAQRRIEKQAFHSKASNFEAMFASKYPVTWVKTKGLKHCLLATPNKV